MTASYNTVHLDDLMDVQVLSLLLSLHQQRKKAAAGPRPGRVAGRKPHDKTQRGRQARQARRDTVNANRKSPRPTDRNGPKAHQEHG